MLISSSQTYQLFLDLDTLPAHVFVKSTKNITRERGWRPIWEKELANIHADWSGGKLEAGFHPGDDIHECAACPNSFERESNNN